MRARVVSKLLEDPGDACLLSRYAVPGIRDILDLKRTHSIESTFSIKNTFSRKHIRATQCPETGRADSEELLRREDCLSVSSVNAVPHEPVLLR
jgi:hypothetical protein